MTDVRRLRLGDDEYEFDQTQLMLSETRLVKQWTGLSPAQWERGLSDMDPDCVAALVCLLKRRAGEDIDFETLDFDYAQFEILDDDTDPTKGEEEPSPSTRPDATPQTPSPTSQPSLSTAESTPPTSSPAPNGLPIPVS